MDIHAFLELLGSTENPLLPSSTAIWLALHLGWALVLGSGVMLLAGRLAERYQWGLGLSLLVWTLLPGPVSPAYWLGLVFQAPSLTSVVLCLGCVLDRFRRRESRACGIAALDPRGLKILLAFGVALGWLLLLDTLACLPVSVYAWGFASAAVAAMLVPASLLWLLRGSLAAGLPWMVLTLFVLSRWPTGNVWDALLDPLLWLLLQLGWLVSVWRRWTAARRERSATRA
ncbi:MAG: hypothetical protein PHS32_08000 [Rhodoferax sp.]|uniref:hypothetical protein n=1 Tax=Rhodoferax sp. TaxID=50421 RepID=UPI00260944A1|nr:hypothetical protein [Rhodoferax sp.]MDD5333673.1 hypothetical protein [Rhodoferax sp.]